MSALSQKHDINGLKKVNLLSRAEMRKVIGGNAPADGCKDLPAADKALFVILIIAWLVGTMEAILTSKLRIKETLVAQ